MNNPFAYEIDILKNFKLSKEQEEIIHNLKEAFWEALDEALDEIIKEKENGINRSDIR